VVSLCSSTTQSNSVFVLRKPYSPLEY